MNVLNLNYLINAMKAAFLLAIVAASFVVSRSALMQHSPISSAVAGDLTITLPLAYLFFIRRSSISKLTVIPVFTGGFIVAALILPPETQFLKILKFAVFPALEVGVLSFAGYTIFKARKTYRTLKTNKFDVMENLRRTLAAEFPSPALGKAAAFEIAVFYYAFFKWRGAKPKENSFTYHREKGVLALLGVFIFLIAAESVAAHFVVGNYSQIAAWILTAFGAYFVFQLFAHAKAVLLRPMVVGEDELSIRCGIIGDAKIAYDKIENIETLNQPFVKEKDVVNITAAGKLSPPNVKISLRETEIFNGFYGFEKEYKAIVLAVDDAENFIAAVKEKILNV